MIDQQIIDKSAILDRFHKNIVSRLVNSHNTGEVDDNETDLLKIEKLILKKYKEIISEL